MALKRTKHKKAALIFIQFIFSIYLCISGAFCRIIFQHATIEVRPVLFYDGKTLAEVIFNEFGVMKHCKLHELEEEHDAEPIIKVSGLPIKYPNFKGMLQLINKCTQLEKPRNSTADIPPSTLSPAFQLSSVSHWALWNGIAPGTKWCGIGDIAESFEELGRETEADACCRAHDHCPIKLKAFRAGYGLINLSLYTKSHCDCDKEFLACLKSTGDRFADMVGNVYFNFMKVQCLKNASSFVCIQNRTDVNGIQQCVQWSEDPNNTKLHVTISELAY